MENIPILTPFEIYAMQNLNHPEFLSNMLFFFNEQINILAIQKR